MHLYVQPRVIQICWNGRIRNQSITLLPRSIGTQAPRETVVENETDIDEY